MDTTLLLIALGLGIIAIIEEIRVIKLKRNVKTLEHYIDMYKNKLENYELDIEDVR